MRAREPSIASDESSAEQQPEPLAEFESLIGQLGNIRECLVRLETEYQGALLQVHSMYQASARNLVHYLALRRQDHRPLQVRLASQGLSSLGRSESHVLATIDAVLSLLHRVVQRAWQQPVPSDASAAVPFDCGPELLDQHTNGLLGPPPAERGVRIMVTMPSEAAEDYKLVHELLERGMDCMRINCAHDDAEAWTGMIENLRRAEAATRRTCKVFMDLAGPKLRTGAVEPGPSVVKIRPRRDPLGAVTTPARVWFSAEEAPRPAPSPTDASLRVPSEWLAQLVVGTRIDFKDARGTSRRLKVIDTATDGCWATAKRTAYIVTGTALWFRSEEGGPKITAAVGDLPSRETRIPLREGELLILIRDLPLGRDATRDDHGQVLTPASIGCPTPEVFDGVRVGEPIWFDDGKIGGVIEAVEPDRIHVRIAHTRAEGGELRGDKGINLPESTLRLAAMTAKDVEDLGFVARHADLVALSFANGVDDVRLLHEHLARLGERVPGTILKIETRRGFENLPAMLLEAMKVPCCGVMIARGDLAVECGFERLAEVQEEILWLCEAAHLPVIWATQVLESLAKEGLPSRAEITDAAMGHRAECVMLNKGPHITEAVQVLDDILKRMEGHQSKKIPMLRALHLAARFSDTVRAAQ